MVRIRTISLAALCAARALALPNVSHAQPTPAPRLTRPPRLTRFVEATWPAGAREAGRRATVVLRLTISATGTVDAAEVTETGGADFDAAAVEAARRFVFEPAEVDGRPSAIRLLYRYVFTVREEAPTTARFEGVVRTRNGRRPVAGVEVTIDGVGRATTDAEGRFVFERVEPGTRRVSLAGERLAPQEVSETFEAGRRVNATYEVSLRALVSRGEDGVDAEVVVRAPPLRRQVVSTEIGADQARRIPGTQGDVLRVVESLPGVARSAAGAGALVVWGAAPEDTRVLIDGVPVPRLYHDGGLRSVLPGDLVQSVELAPGGYGAPWGRGIGGVVQATTRPLDGDGVHGALSADLYDAAVNARASLGRGVRVGAGVRRSHLDALLGAVNDGQSVSSLFPIPRYFDAQARASWDVSRTDRVELTGILSRDEIQRSAASPDPFRVTSDTRAVGFERLWLRWRRTLAGGAVLTVTPWFGRDARAETSRVGAVETSLERESFVGGVRAQWQGNVTSILNLSVGADVELNASSLRRRGSVALPAREGDVRAFGQPPPDQVAADNWSTTFVGVAPWLEGDLALLRGKLHVTGGLRVDPYVLRVSRRTPLEGDLPALGLLRESFTVEPRLALRWTPFERLSVKVAFGRYAQPPQPEDLSAAFGTPALGLAQATHALAGVTVRPTRSLSVEVTTFVSWSEGLAVRPTAESPRLAESLAATGEGRAYGAQVLVRQELARGFLGWLSYSVMRSERRASPGDAWRLFDYDQTHVLTALFTWEIGRGFEVGVRFRYATGMPRTPVTGAWFDATRDRWQPTFGAQNADRLPDFIQADARVAKTFRLGSTRLEVSLEVQNVTNRENPEEVVWSADWRRRAYITGLPLLPVLGARWTF